MSFFGTCRLSFRTYSTPLQLALPGYTYTPLRLWLVRLALFVSEYCFLPLILYSIPTADATSMYIHTRRWSCASRTHARTSLNVFVALFRLVQPFILYNIPSVDATSGRWSDPAYMEKIFGPNTKYATEHSTDNHFMYFNHRLVRCLSYLRAADVCICVMITDHITDDEGIVFVYDLGCLVSACDH